MSNRIIQINSNLTNEKTLLALVEKYSIDQFWQNDGKHGMVSYYMLVKTENSQEVIDAIATITGHDANAKIIIHAVEAVVDGSKDSNKEEKEEEKKNKKRPFGISREELYETVSKGANLNFDFLLLVFFSTLVASVGLVQDNTAVVIGAMVIAPMLGPNLAFSLSTSLADFNLSFKALKTNLTGFSLTLIISIIAGYFLDFDPNNKEILSRTKVEMDAIVLALASGAAGVLSLTSGVSSVLVGVMVAVALLPPATVFGLMVGSNHFDLAWGALILLGINIVCVNIAANVVFLFKGVAPRTWYDKEKAKKKMTLYMTFWIILLAVLSALVYYRNYINL